MITDAELKFAVAHAIVFLQKTRDDVLPEHPDRAPVLRAFRRMFDAEGSQLRATYPT